MSVWGRRGSYSATAFVVVFFVVLASIAHVLRPYIDRQSNVELTDSPSDFMRVARYQRVEWKNWSPETVALARRRDRPILVYAGTVYGELRPKFDSLAEVNEVAELMNREFVCVRADAQMQSKWRSGPLQLTRTERGDSANFALYIFAPEGRLIAAPSTGELSQMGNSGFLVFLRHALNEYSDTNPKQIHEQAVKEAFELSGGLSSQPGSPTQYAERLLALKNPEIGGFMNRSESELLANEYQLMLDLGHAAEVASSLDLLLSRPQQDALWGGFFERYSNTERAFVFAKTGVSNAEMLIVLTRLAIHLNDEILRQEAVRQFGYVISRFADEKSGAYDFAEWKDARRSPKHSFSARRLRGLLTPAEQAIAEVELGLDVRKNTQAIPYVVHRNKFRENETKLDTILEKLRGGVANPEDYSGRLQSYESQAASIAALCHAARLLDDPDLKAQAVQMFIPLRERMRTGTDDVLGWPGAQSSESAGISCYLAYCSAAWEAMLLMEDESIGLDGLKVLNRAIYLFSDSSGELIGGRFAGLPPEWQKLFGPEVLDLLGRSAVSEVIRQGGNYTAWQGSNTRVAGVRAAVEGAIRHSGWVIDRLNIRAGGMARALHSTVSGNAIGVPPRADWARLEREFPGVMKVPYFSAEGGYAVRKDGNWSETVPIEALRSLL